MNSERTLTRIIIPTLMVLLMITACGRRERPAVFDAVTHTPTAQSVRASPLPPSALRVRWGGTTMPLTVAPGSNTLVLVTFTNEGDQVWPDLVAGDQSLQDGTHAVRLGYAWSRPSGGAPTRTRRPARADLPNAIPPQASVTLGIGVVAPEAPGDYILEFDLVQELVFWFSDRGADTLRIPVRVDHGEATTAQTGTP